MRKLVTYLSVVTTALLTGAAPVCADGLDGKLPADFVRVTALSALTTDEYYAIGAIGSAGNAYLLSQAIRAGSDAKLMGVYVADGLQTTVEVSESNTVWRLAAAPSGEANAYLLTGGDGTLSISAPVSGNKTTLTVSTTESTPWRISENGDGTFTLTSTADATHSIGVNEYSTSDTFFGSYLATGGDSHALYFYRLPVAFSDRPGAATTPTDGTRCALMADGSLADTTLAGFDATGYVLCDGSVAPADGMAAFTAATTDAGTFTLRTDAGYLGFDLSTQEEAAAWRVVNGHIATAEATPRYLVYLASTGNFAVLDDDAATAQGATDVLLPAVAATPASATGSDGALTLTGGWSAEKLATIDLSACTALYLDSISLPVACPALQDDGANNTIIYINATDAAAVPQTWRIVVECGDGTPQLLRAAALTDRRPLYIGRSFTAQAGALTYTRQCAADGNWETLCLPFAADLPEGFLAETLTTAGEDELTFADAADIEAQQPVIFRQSTGGGAELVLTNRETAQLSQEDSPAAAQVLFGNYRMLNVTADDAGIYLLSGDGDYFVRALAGSALDPFRCYLRLNAQTDSIRVKHGLTGIQSALGENRPAPRYDLTGRRLHGAASKGFYITQGKKYIKL